MGYNDGQPVSLREYFSIKKQYKAEITSVRMRKCFRTNTNSTTTAVLNQQSNALARRPFPLMPVLEKHISVASVM
jgi:hypothetical protein